MTPAEKTTALQEITALEATLTDLKLRVLATAGDVADAAGARDIGSWAAHLTHADPTAARADARLAEALDRRWTRVAAGMADGAVALAQARVIVTALEALPDDLDPTLLAVALAQARVIVTALEALPDDLDPTLLAKAETQLVAYCADFSPAELRRLGRHILHVVAPDIAEAHQARLLEAEEQRAREKCRLTLKPIGDGTTRISALLPDTDATRLRTYLEAFTSPRKHDDATLGEEDRIPYPRRLGQALCALLEHLDPAKLPDHGGDATTLMVTIDLDSLRTDLATGGLIDGHLTAGDNMSATAIRRLACTAKIIPVVLGGNGEILDLGRTRRLYSPSQRKALRLRDQQCRAEGCTVPATWCEAHHLKPWTQGGRTNLNDGILLCNHHHHRAHDRQYEADRLPNGDLRFHRRP
ncbi:HNH endonuclease signature motif containing protein [Nocardioides pelophilus]